MSYNRNARREFLNKLALIAASGGTAAMFPQLRMIGNALANTTGFTDYKALVCIYFSGGNDSWNMLVPYDSSRFGVYATSRSGVYNAATNPGGLGLAQPVGPQINLQKITDGNDLSATTNQYFMHPSLSGATGVSGLSDIYRSGKLAFAVNVGSLVKPIQMVDYSNPANRPPQLFSHSDQENLWHQANTNASSTLGWGGLCADQVGTSNLNKQLSTCISISGANRFEVGISTAAYQMASGGLQSLQQVCNPTPCGGVSSTSVRDNALNAMLMDTYQNDFANEYGSVFTRGRELYNLLSAGLTGTTLNTTFPTNNSLASQLQQVAKMIKLSSTQKYAQRQIYYVRYGGFDLHSGLMSGNGDHQALLTQVAAAMVAFYTAMGPTDLNIQNSVTAFTATEFARTLNSNGLGSDHAWGGVQMVMGGAVNGGKLYSDGGGPIKGFPNQALNAPNNFSRGQMIPGIGVEQYAATMAKWMGASDLNAIFPNLKNFSKQTLGFV